MKTRGWFESRANVVFMGGLLLAVPPQRCTPEGGGGGSGGSSGASSSAGQAGKLAAEAGEAGNAEAGGAGSSSGSGGSAGTGGTGESGGSAGNGGAAGGSGPIACPADTFQMIHDATCYECPGYIYEDSTPTCAMLASDLASHHFDAATHQLYLRAGEKMPAPKPGWGAYFYDVAFDPEQAPFGCSAAPVFTAEGDYFVADLSAYFACPGHVSDFWMQYLWPSYGCASYIENYSDFSLHIGADGESSISLNCFSGTQEPPVIFGNLVPYPRPARYDASTPTAVKDNQTGLVWEQHASSSYPRLIQAEAVSYCDERQYAGFDDWRLPSAHELLTLVRFDLAGNHLDPAALPYNDTDQFWSSDGDAESYLGMLVSFAPYQSYRSDPYAVPVVAEYSESEYPVRCVRGGNPPAIRFTDKSDGTVRDNRSNLVWEQAPTQGHLTPMQAQAYCRGLTLAGGHWRVPTITEVLGLTDNGSSVPTLDPLFDSASAFPPSVQWSSTQFVEVAEDWINAGWFMGSDGRPTVAESYASIDTQGDVRCVR